jgi:Cu/Ag efflux protein CusF
MDFLIGDFAMMFFTKSLGTLTIVALLSLPVMAATHVATGKIKSVDADSRSFLLTASDNKDFTFKIDDKMVINRDGKEGKTDLKAGDTITVCYDKGILNRTTHYVLVQEGSEAKSTLVCGTVKGYDAERKELTFTNSDKQDSVYPIGSATMKTKMEDSKIDTVKIGDRALLLLDIVDGKSILRCIMVD